MQGTLLLHCCPKAGTAVGFHNARLSSLTVARVSWIIYSLFFLIRGLKNSRRTFPGFSKFWSKLIKHIHVNKDFRNQGGHLIIWPIFLDYGLFIDLPYVEFSQNLGFFKLIWVDKYVCLLFSKNIINCNIVRGNYYYYIYILIINTLLTGSVEMLQVMSLTQSILFDVCMP